MSLRKHLINEIISDKQYIHLPDEFGSWVDPKNNDIKNYIWESDYISKVYKKEKVTFKIDKIWSMDYGEFYYHTYDSVDSFISNKKTYNKFELTPLYDYLFKDFKGNKKSLNNFDSNLSSSMKSLLQKQSGNFNLGNMELPILYSKKDKSLIFTHSIIYFVVQLGYYIENDKIKFKQGHKASRKYGNMDINIINIDQSYSLDEHGENPYPIEKDSESII